MNISALLIAVALCVVQDARIAHLVKQLGSDSFEQRQAASKTLDAIGASALEAIQNAALADGDAEVRRRAGQLVQSITRWPVRCFTGHTWWVASVAISPEGRYVLSGGTDGTIRFWDVRTGQELRKLKCQGSVLNLKFLKCGEEAVAATGRGAIYRWGLNDGAELARVTLDRELTRAMATSPFKVRVSPCGDSQSAVR